MTSLVLVASGFVAWGALGPGESKRPLEIEVPAGTAVATDPAGAALALQELRRAIETNDAERARSVAAATPTAQVLLESLVTNAAAARIVDVSLRYIDEQGSIGEDGTWTAAVAVEWRYDDFDVSPASTETVVGFVVEADEVRISQIGADSLRTPLWMTGPLAVSRTDSTLVLSADAARLGQYARLAERSVWVVSQVLTDWDKRLVVEVPRDQTGLERALDVEAGYYRQIAAVTGSADGSFATDSPIHVYVNPDVFVGLGARGQSVVLSHEAAHVAGDGPTSRAPTWLVEGFADYVALRDSTLPLERTAAQIRDMVREEGVPSDLPSDSDFDAQGSHLGAVYESAWLACQVLAERRDDEAFLGLYADLSAGAPLERSLRRSFDWSSEEFVIAWQSELMRL
ncbi:hypothetical protein [Nocardioides sp.]|uniref:hypothetical protein n=1 Tax=Nocardioides sp. TaxID=35761 RepID=UPI00321B2768